MKTVSKVVEKVVIATRESRLALWQAGDVKALLESRLGWQVELLGMTTQGDEILDRALSQVGGKGLFVKELEVALADGRADLAVHSLKDVPMDFPEGFALAGAAQGAAAGYCHAALGRHLKKSPARRPVDRK